MAKQESAFSKLVGTRVTEPETTFAWELNETRKDLQVICRYGEGNNTNNTATASIPYDSLESVPVVPQQENPAIVVEGNVNAIWFQDGYVVSFGGSMNRPNVVNVAGFPAVVGASLSGEMARAARQ